MVDVADGINVLTKNDTGRYWMFLEFKGEPRIRFDCPADKASVDDKFTISWRGHADQQLLLDAATRFRSNTDKYFRALYFFEKVMHYLPSCLFENISDSREDMLIKDHGDPVFIRYEFYTESKEEKVIQNCRAAFWAMMSSNEEISLRKETQNEIGVYITFTDFINDKYLGEIVRFIEQTISPKIELNFKDYLSKVGNALYERIENYGKLSDGKMTDSKSQEGALRWVKYPGISIGSFLSICGLAMMTKMI